MPASNHHPTPSPTRKSKFRAQPATLPAAEPAPGKPSGAVDPGAQLGWPLLRSRNRAAVLLTLAVVLVLAVTGCGSDGGGDSDAPGAGSTDVRDEEEGRWLITQQDRVYTVDDLVTAGWKKSKQLETETLTGSIDAWYGFFQQKDIELRFYETHDTAIEHGVGHAEETRTRTCP